MQSLDDDAVDPDRVVAEKLGVTVRSLERWDTKPEIGFPKPLRINGRRYRRRSEISEFLRRAAVGFAAKAAT